MSGNQNQEKTQDLFGVYQENTDKFFNGIRQTVPQYHQSVTNVQQEYLQACESVLSASINVQKEIAEKFGIKSVIPDATLKVINNAVEDYVKIRSIKNQVALSSIDAAQQSIKLFKDNVILLSGFYQSWISSLPKITN